MKFIPLKEIDVYSFWNLPKLKSIKFSAGLKVIPFQTLGKCEALESITIPEGVEEMRHSFSSLKNLKEVRIPASVKNMEGCFYGCDKLTDVYFSGTEEQWKKIITETKYIYSETGSTKSYITMAESNLLPNAKIHFNSGNNVKVTLNGKYISFDQAPVIQNGRTLVPVRAIFEELGATVQWNGQTRTVTATKGNTTISMTIGSRKFYKNGQEITLDVEPKIINSRTIVPVRVIAESFNCKVDWDGKTRTVIITQK